MNEELGRDNKGSDITNHRIEENIMKISDRTAKGINPLFLDIIFSILISLLRLPKPL